MLLRKDLIRVNADYASREEALRSFAEVYVKAGVVKDTYPQAILDREKVYPTGLPAIAFDIAIPHCDSQYVNEPAIGVCTLAHPLEFNQMGGGEPIHPVMLFMNNRLNTLFEALCKRQEQPTVDDLARRLGVSTRTVYNDVDKLNSLLGSLKLEIIANNRGTLSYPCGLTTDFSKLLDDEELLYIDPELRRSRIAEHILMRRLHRVTAEVAWMTLGIRGCISLPACLVSTSNVLLKNPTTKILLDERLHPSRGFARRLLGLCRWPS